MYIAGNFTFTADDGLTTVHNIARYSNGVWSALANGGVENSVNALAVMGNTLYVGGAFSQTADGSLTNINNIARYDTVGKSWSGLANLGIGGSVSALAVIGSNL